MRLCPDTSIPVDGEGGKSTKPAANNSMVTAVALFDKTGDLIFVGQSKGTITVVDANSLRFVDMIKVTATTLSILLGLCMALQLA